MTLDQFIAELEKTPRDWRVVWGAAIRRVRPNYNCCPITSLYDQASASWPSCFLRLGLSLENAKAIMDAADNYRKHDPALRSRLLAACGIKE